MPHPPRRSLILGAVLSVILALPSAAECYVDYKAKQDNPLRLAYGVSQVSDAVCGKPKRAKEELAPRLAADGWTLLKIVSSFGPEGLDERKASAGEFFLRY
ncbi:MAG: hypothetical protein H7317_19305 [Pseudorhodobacter sp.]|nr:hypothetical protein [Pseudorhodobacter sp.]